MVAEKPPVQFEHAGVSVGKQPAAPASDASPNMAMLTTVPLPTAVNTIGDPLPATSIEHECPVVKPTQLWFGSPGLTPVRKYSKFGCNSNCRNGLNVVAPPGGGDPKGKPPLIKTPSVRISG